MLTRYIPGALLGVVGGAGVLKGSKFTDSELDWDCFFCGRGVAGDRDVLLGWLQFLQVNDTINYWEVQSMDISSLILYSKSYHHGIYFLFTNIQVVYLESCASCFCVNRSLSTRVCSEVEIETEVAL